MCQPQRQLGHNLVQRNTGRGRGQGEGGSLSKAMPLSTPATSPGLYWSEPSSLHGTYWIEEKSYLNVFGQKRPQELHLLLSQHSRTIAVTQGPVGKNEKSTRSHARNMLVSIAFFPLILPIPISPKSHLHFFTEAAFPVKKRSQQ